jgi:hypothetical protein
MCRQELKTVASLPWYLTPNSIGLRGSELHNHLRVILIDSTTMADTYRSAATELFHSTEVRQLFPEEHGRIISVTTDTPIAQVFKVLCPPPPPQLSGTSSAAIT